MACDARLMDQEGKSRAVYMIAKHLEEDVQVSLRSEVPRLNNFSSHKSNVRVTIDWRFSGLEGTFFSLSYFRDIRSAIYTFSVKV